MLHVPHQQPLTLAIRQWLEKFAPESLSDTHCSLYGDIHISGFTIRSLRLLLESSGYDAYFVRTAGLWSRFYDPFFLRTLFRNRAWAAIARKTARGVIDNAGTAVGLGDWVIGYFVRR